MVSITLKNIPKQLHERLKKQAKEHRRSLNGEILARLEQDQDEVKMADSEFLQSVRKLKAKFKGSLSAEEIKAAINEGRP